MRIHSLPSCDSRTRPSGMTAGKNALIEPQYGKWDNIDKTAACRYDRRFLVIHRVAERMGEPAGERRPRSRCT